MNIRNETSEVNPKSRTELIKNEKFWEIILKEIYGEDIGVQYKYMDNIFDFIHIKSRTLFECKLGLKDFSKNQYEKYIQATSLTPSPSGVDNKDQKYNIVYIFGYDCIVDLSRQILYTTNSDYYRIYFLTNKKPTELDEIIKNFPVIKLSSVKDYFTNVIGYVSNYTSGQVETNNQIGEEHPGSESG